MEIMSRITAAHSRSAKSLADLPDLLSGLRDATDPAKLAQLLSINSELTLLLGDPKDEEDDDEHEVEELAALSSSRRH